MLFLKKDEFSVKIDEFTVKIDDFSVKIDEFSVKIIGITSRIRVSFIYSSSFIHFLILSYILFPME